ncbi:MAG: patatin-like phospholipase family protein [Bacteroidota bacterium]
MQKITSTTIDPSPPPSSPEPKYKIGLCLSGGGYRATAYHLGTLRKLREMGILHDIDVISTVSGGSITGALYAIEGEDFTQFEKKLLTGVKRSVIRHILLTPQFILVGLAVLSWLAFLIYLDFLGNPIIPLLLFTLLIVFLGYFQFEILPISRWVESAYRRFFFGRKTLDKMPNFVHLVINATNLDTGRPFTFSRDEMDDSTYSYRNGQKQAVFTTQGFPVARAVAASSCVPFAFSPIKIAKRFFVDHQAFMDDQKDEPAEGKGNNKATQPRIVDGGVYDNQGLHCVTWKNRASYCKDAIIVSDAGNRMPFQHRYPNIITLLIRTSDVFMRRIKNLQMIKELYYSFGHPEYQTAYQSMGWDCDKSIDGFLKRLKNDQISESVWKKHGLTQAIVNGIKNGDKTLIKQAEGILKASINYAEILKQAPTQEELKIARTVATNLVPLSDAQISALTKQAATMTEIQVRLFCPNIVPPKRTPESATTTPELRD